jgi:uncharacterized repeat protein (TIGR03803 family)
MWLSVSFSWRTYRRHAKNRTTSRPKHRPRLEALEDRLVLSNGGSGIDPLYTLASFNGSNGDGPQRNLLMDGSGNLYGTTGGGGAYSDGTIFELAQGSSTITTLASFNGTNGANPEAGLIIDASGNLYGTTGEVSQTTGSVFELAQGSGTITTLARFNGTNGGWVRSPLVMDGSGNLYGTTFGGAGAAYDGTVFEVAQGSGAITDLALFNNTTAPAVRPWAGLIMDSSGNLYGTTPNGGGTVYEVVHGSNAITILATFNGTTNGGFPRGPVIMDSSGNLYGTTLQGGAYNAGTIFELAHGSSTITTLASFNGINGSGPGGGLLMDTSGTLYGTTTAGGAYANGTVFGLPQGSSTIWTLASFNSTNGASPNAGLIMDSSGNLYGATSAGGAYGNGTVFEVVRGVAYRISGVPSTTAGAPQQVTVTVLNADLTTDTGYTGTIHFTSSDSHAALPADYTFQSSDQGVHTFTATLYTAGSQSITGTDTSNNLLSNTLGVTVTPAALTRLVISGPSSVRANNAFSVTVTAADAYGNTVSGYTGTVHFTSSDGSAVLPANYTFTASDASVHTFAGLKLKTRGVQTLTVTDTVNSSITGSLNITVT